MKIVSVVFILVFSLITELLTAMVLINLMQLPFPDVRTNPYSFIAGAIVSKLFLIILVKIALIFISRKEAPISISSIILILSIPMVSIVTVVDIMGSSLYEYSYSPSFIVAFCGILYINIVVFALFEGLSRRMDENNAFRTRETQLLLQQEQYKNIIEGYQETKRLRHDMTNHMIAVDGYLREEDIAAASKYIQRLVGGMEDTRKEVISGNVAIDALINSKINQALRKGSMIKTSVLIPHELDFDEMDLCVILGNVLDNAIEACERMNADDEAGCIELSMKQVDGKLLIKVKNPVDVSTLKIRNGKYVTSKSEKAGYSHGNGINNTNRIVEKHGGNLHTKVLDGTFQLSVLIPLEAFHYI